MPEHASAPSSSSSPDYAGLASGAADAGDMDLARRLHQHADDLSLDNRAGELTKELIEDTVTNFQRLVQWGDEAAAPHSQYLPQVSSNFREGFEGVLLYQGTDVRLALPVLNEVYDRLGMTDARSSTQVDHVRDEERVTLHPLPNVTLMEVQQPLDETTGMKIYELWGHRANEQ